MFNVLLTKSCSIDIFVETLSIMFSLRRDNFEETDLSIKDKFDLILVVSTGGE